MGAKIMKVDPNNDKLKMICALICIKKLGVTNLYLQKLLYFIQAYTLVDTGKPAFENRMEAWTYGPVVIDAYYEMKNNTNNFIKGDYKELDGTLKENIEMIIDELQDKTAFDLVGLTHSYDPWKNAWSNQLDNVITPKDIEKYHKKRLNDQGKIF
jgi:uncharacterized phage-associated protein